MYLKLPGIGKVSLKYEKQTKTTGNNCFGSVSASIVFSLKKILPSFLNDILPAHQRSNIILIYSFFHCDSVYVNRTSQRLEEQIRQHVPKFIRNKIKPQKDFPRRQCKSTQNVSVSDSAIGQHLLDKKICAEKYDTNWLSILTT